MGRPTMIQAETTNPTMQTLKSTIRKIDAPEVTEQAEAGRDGNEQRPRDEEVQEQVERTLGLIVVMNH